MQTDSAGAAPDIPEQSQHSPDGAKSQVSASPVIQSSQVIISSGQVKHFHFCLYCRTLLNSPLLRRKKSLFDSSEEDVSESEKLRHQANSGSGYQNLETFQKQKLRQKVSFLIWFELLDCFIYFNFQLRKLNTLESDSAHQRESGRFLAHPSSPDSSPRLSPRQIRKVFQTQHWHSSVTLIL